jgi:hypothetical protein
LALSDPVLGFGELVPETILALAVVVGRRPRRFAVAAAVRVVACGHGTIRLFLLAHLFAQLTAQVANAGRHNALEPSDEQRGRDGHFLVRHKNLVQVDHGDRNEPVGGDHRGNVRVLLRKLHGDDDADDADDGKCTVLEATILKRKREAPTLLSVFWAKMMTLADRGARQMRDESKANLRDPHYPY